MMFSRGTIRSRLVVFAAALLMSTIAVGAAVGPGTAGSSGPIVSATYA